MYVTIRNQLKDTPYLASKRLDLYPFCTTNLTEEYVGWLNDGVVMQFSEQRHKKHTYESCKSYYNKMVQEGHFFWAIFNKAHQKHIGNFTAYLDHTNQIADLAIMIGDPHYQKQGLGKEAWDLVMNHLLVNGIRKVNAGTMSVNEPMLKIMWSSGMSQEGCRKKHFIWQGQEVDLILGAKFKE